MAPIAMTQVMKLNSRDWPALSAQAEWELVDSNHAMAMVAFPDENSEEPMTWAARLLGAQCAHKIAHSEKMQKVIKEKSPVESLETPDVESIPGSLALEDPFPDPKELAREARSKHVAKGCGQTIRSNTQCQWTTVVAEEDEDASHLQMLRKTPVRVKGSGKCQVKDTKGKTIKKKDTKDAKASQEKDGKIKPKEHPQIKEQTSRIDIREGLSIMGFA